MLYTSLVQTHRSPKRAAIVDTNGTTSWESLARQTRDFRDRLEGLRPLRIGILMHPTAETIATLAALDGNRHHAFLLDGNLDATGKTQLAHQLHLDACLDPANAEIDRAAFSDVVEDTSSPPQPDVAESLVTLLTSGTEGEPKAATHTWNSLARPVRRLNEMQTWLLAYRPHLYAGMQVILQALLNEGTLIMPSSVASPDEIVRAMLVGQVQFASATPSYWRRLLTFAERSALSRIPLRQITLGGETVDQPLLDQLQSVYPQSRIVHIYATTELGRCFSVTDGKAGFPLQYLTHEGSDAAELKIEDGQLLVRSPNRMLGYDGRVDCNDEPWRATGDLVELVGDRVYFAGRIGDMINVGGNKVRPVAVERLLRTIEGIEDVRVYGQSSSVAGQIVACDVVPRRGCDVEQLTEKIHREARRCLASHEVPRIVRIVDVIPTSAAGKVVRRQE